MASSKGKVVLITGAAGGLGSATALHFVKQGASVSLTDVDRDKLDEVGKACTDAAGDSNKVLVTEADVLKDDHLQTIVSQTIAKFEHLDILINLAGIAARDSLETLEVPALERIFQINVFSVMRLTQLAVPYLKLTKGCIVNISSVTGVKSFSGVMSYGLSKSAVAHFTKCSALELAKYGIRVNAVSPAIVQTDIFYHAGLVKSEQDYEKLMNKHVTAYPIGRLGTADDVVNAIAFLASDEASWITGHVLPLGGGLHELTGRMGLYEPVEG